MANKPIPNKLITTLITILTTLSLLLVTTSPVNATTNYTQITDRPIQGVVITDPEAQELIKELEQYGFTKTATGNNKTETITFTQDKLTITLTKHNNTIQTRTHTDRWVVGVPGLSYGEDLYGFYLKMEGYLQATLWGATSLGPHAAIKIVLKEGLKAARKHLPRKILKSLGVSEVISITAEVIGGIVNDIVEIVSGACMWLKPRYIRFDPFSTSCGDPPHHDPPATAGGGWGGYSRPR